MPFPNVRWIGACLLAGSLVALFAPPLHAQRASAEVKQLREEVTELEIKRMESQALVDVLEAEQRLVPAIAAAPLDVAKLATRDVMREALAEDLKGSEKKRVAALDRLAEKTGKEKQDAIDGWKKARDAAVQVHEDYVETKARLGANPGKVPLFDLRLVLILLWGTVLVGLGFLLAIHVLRVSLRQRWRSGLTTAVLFALSIASPLFAQPAPGLADSPSALTVERDGLRVQVQQLEIKASILKTESRNRRSPHLRVWEAILMPLGGALNRQFAEWEEEALEKLRAVLVDVKVTERTIAAGLKVLDEAAAERDQLADLVNADSARNRLRRSLKLGACVAFPALALLPVWWARKKARKRLAKDADQCPCCLAVGSLEEKVATVQDERYPEPRYYSCPQCFYEFRSSYRKLPRLCFPTVGVPASGKTHWLVSAYDLVKNNNVGVDASIQRAPSLADETFDHLIEMVLESHQNPAATVYSDKMPAPLTFHVADTDRLGRAKALLNLFDCSGEIMYKNINTDVVRRRALLMDGFLLFLDPTQVSRQGPTPGLDAQINRLSSFHAEMRDIRGLDVGDRIDVPIAVCVSKVDLLLARNPLRGQARPLLNRLRETMGWPPTLDLLKERSQSIAEMLPRMFPGWDVIKTLHEGFGDRFLFFPMTPVGMEEGELGIEDLRQRTIVPFGILEPVLWLMHMRGYCVLPKASE